MGPLLRPGCPRIRGSSAGSVRAIRCGNGSGQLQYPVVSGIWFPDTSASRHSNDSSGTLDYKYRGRTVTTTFHFPSTLYLSRTGRQCDSGTRF